MEKIGQVNRYICKDCKKQVYTVNLNSGTTPFGVKCPHCKSLECFSAFYQIGPIQPPNEIVITHCFYRPHLARLDELNAEAHAILVERGNPSPDERMWDDHVLLGGLVFDPLGKYPAVPEPEPPFRGEDDYDRCRAFMLKTYGRAKQVCDPFSETIWNPMPAEYGVITASKKEFHPGEPLFLFRASDKLMIMRIADYADDCEDSGCSQEHVDGVRAALEKIRVWRLANKNLVKKPD